MRLEDEIRKAVNDGIAPSSLGQHIKTAPVLTSLGHGKQLAEMADFSPDPEHQEDFISFWKYEAFAYWKIRETEDAVYIAGIAWDDQQNSTLFYAMIYPP